MVRNYMTFLKQKSFKDWKYSVGADNLNSFNKMSQNERNFITIIDKHVERHFDEENIKAEQNTIGCS